MSLNNMKQDIWKKSTLSLQVTRALFRYLDPSNERRRSKDFFKRILESLWKQVRKHRFHPRHLYFYHHRFYSCLKIILAKLEFLPVLKDIGWIWTFILHLGHFDHFLSSHQGCFRHHQVHLGELQCWIPRYRSLSHHHLHFRQNSQIDHRSLGIQSHCQLHFPLHPLPRDFSALLRPSRIHPEVSNRCNFAPNHRSLCHCQIFQKLIILHLNVRPKDCSTLSYLTGEEVGVPSIVVGYCYFSPEKGLQKKSRKKRLSLLRRCIWGCELCVFGGDLWKTAASTLHDRHTGWWMLLLWGPANNALGDRNVFLSCKSRSHPTGRANWAVVRRQQRQILAVVNSSAIRAGLMREGDQS